MYTVLSHSAATIVATQAPNVATTTHSQGCLGTRTFTEVLVVPPLARACFLACHEAGPGAGLKQLRSVCRGARSVLQGLVQGYTLRLRCDVQSDSQPSPELFQFLQSVHLTSLNVVVCSQQAGDILHVHSDSLQLAAQLNAFIAQLGPTLITVKRLHITLPRYATSTDFSESEVAATQDPVVFLLPLASACPNLAQLTISGHVGQGLLQAFGELCPKLASLHASLADLSDTTLARLPTLLPSLSSLSVLPPAGNEKDAMRKLDHALSNRVSCIALQACNALLSFDTPSCLMTAEVWEKLPPGLLRCGASEVDRLCNSSSPSAPGRWMQHAGLKHFQLSSSASISLQDMVLLLKAAPGLASIGVKHAQLEVTTEITACMAEDLLLLSKRIQAGLVFASTPDGAYGSTSLSRVALTFRLDTRSKMSTFMRAGLPELAAYTDLRFLGDQEFLAGDLSEFARVFPSLQKVRFRNVDLDASELQALARCKALWSVELGMCEGVTQTGLKAFCDASTSVRRLTCDGCRDISVEDGRAMEGEKWSKRVQVWVTRGAVLQAEDAKEACRQKIRY